MKTIRQSLRGSLSALIAFIVLSGLSASEGAELSAQEILAKLHAGFPPDPIAFEAQMQTKTPRGKVETTYLVNILYSYANETFSATLTIRDAFGTPLEKIAARGIGSGSSNYQYFRGEDLEPARVPEPTAPIRDTDFLWQDLTLAFLWWPGGSVAGTDSLKGRECHVLDIANPSPLKDGIEGARLWIDAEMYVLLRAKFYNSENDPIKRFDVKSFAKTDDLWMVKDLDMRSYPSRRRTTLRVRNVEVVENEEGEPEDEKRQS